MFGTVLTALFSLLLAYVCWRVATVPALARRLPHRAIVGIGGVLWGIFLLGRFWGHGGVGPVAAAVEFLGMALLGWVFLVFLVLFTVDLVTVFGRLLPRWAPSLRGGALVVGGYLGKSAVQFCGKLRRIALFDDLALVHEDHLMASRSLIHVGSG